MLSKPKHGWSDFQLDGTSVYGLSYLDDIAFEWLEDSIHGLEVLRPFCVKGFLEPDRFICNVSYWNCHIICEYEERKPLEHDDVRYEVSHTNMLEFCKFLYYDIKENIDEWVGFIDYGDVINNETRKSELVKKLDYFQMLMEKREEFFKSNRCFL